MGDLSKLRFGLAAPPTEIEYGFCDGSPEPASIDNISVEPFPILVQNGASVTLAVQITLNEPLPEGASVSLKGTLCIHQVELVVEPCPGLCDGGGVGEHADGPLHLGEVAPWHHCWRLVVDTDLKASGAPVNELDAA